MYFITVPGFLQASQYYTPQYVIKENPGVTYQLELKSRAEKLVGKQGGSCVSFLRQFAGVDKTEVAPLAKNTKVNSQIPEIGSIMVTNESSKGHVTQVIDLDEQTVTVIESNVPMDSGIIGIRTFKLNDPRIIGYVIL